jgi:hypothetical protein
MNREEREVYVQKAMLKALADIGGYLMPESSFFAQLNLSVVPPILFTEFHEQLQKLASKRWITSVRDDFGTIKHKLSDAGRAALLEG